MQLLVAASGSACHVWVNEAWEEYSRRMPPSLLLSLREIPLAKRGKNADTRRLTDRESKALLAAMPGRARVIALDVRGKPGRQSNWQRTLKTGWVKAVILAS